MSRLLEIICTYIVAFYLIANIIEAIPIYKPIPFELKDFR